MHTFVVRLQVVSEQVAEGKTSSVKGPERHLYVKAFVFTDCPTRRSRNQDILALVHTPAKAYDS